MKTSIIEAPMLLGKNLNYAAKTLSEHNLNLRILTQKEDNDLPDGTIISQTPAPGQKVKTNQSIFCAISIKAETGITPSLLNQTNDQITKIIKKENIRTRIHTFASNYSEGICFGQIPAPGSLLEQKMVLTYISAGTNKMVLFPSLKGLLVSEVIEFLKPYNLNPTLFHRGGTEAHHQCKICKIADQKPLSGSLVDLAKPINIQLQVR